MSTRVTERRRGVVRWYCPSCDIEFNIDELNCEFGRDVVCIVCSRSLGYIGQDPILFKELKEEREKEWTFVWSEIERELESYTLVNNHSNTSGTWTTSMIWAHSVG